MKKLLFACLFVFVAWSGTCQDRSRIIVDIPTDQKPWSDREINTNNFQFAIVTDRTGGHRPGVFLEGIHRLNLMQPEFVLSVGDLIEGYTEDTDRLDAEWTEFNGFIDSLSVPFFYVPGNHDITNQVMEDKWKELYGVTYYHFVYNDVLFLCLNSEDNLRGAGRGTIDDEQYEYIKKTLEENQDVKWTLVFMHQPLWVQEDTKRWNDVEALLADREHNVFAGHYHRYWKTKRNNGKYIALATTGGGSPLRGTAYGEFDHVVWVTMTDEGPILANLLLEGVWDENIVTEDLIELVRNRPYPISQETVYAASENSYETTLRITNDSDYPMEVRLEGFNNQDWDYSLSENALRVEPNDVKDIRMTMAAMSDDGEIRAPVHLNTEVSYLYPGRTDVVLQQEFLVGPVRKYLVTHSTSPVKVDGKMSEWAGEWMSFGGELMKGKPFDYSGPKDLQVSFQVATDDNNLYLAFRIDDDEIYMNEKGSLWSQDALLVGLDPREAGVSSQNKGEGRNQAWLGYLRSFRETDPTHWPNDAPVEVESAMTRTDTGVALEMAIPLSYLEENQPGGWENFRLILGYYDYDDEGEQRTEHYWYPAWDSDGNLVGSGTFFREVVTNEP